MNSDILSEGHKIYDKVTSDSQQYNLSSNQDKGLNQANFMALAKISEQERIEII